MHGSTSDSLSLDRNADRMELDRAEEATMPFEIDDIGQRSITRRVKKMMMTGIEWWVRNMKREERVEG